MWTVEKTTPRATGGAPSGGMTQEGSNLVIHSPRQTITSNVVFSTEQIILSLLSYHQGQGFVREFTFIIVVNC